MKYYVDTCVWIDFVLDRYDVQIFTECLRRKDKILYSYILQEELLKVIDYDQVKSMLDILHKIIVTVKVTDDEITEASELSYERNLPFPDVLHAIIARDNDAVLVTRDKHFLSLNDICLVELL